MNKARDIIKEDLKSITESIWDIASQLEGKTLLISGGAGFIGSYIIAVIQLLNQKKFKQKCTVISLDNYITGSPRGLLPLSPDKYIRFVKHNVITPYVTRKKIDYIVNAAGIASPIYYHQSPLETVDVTIHGLRNLLNIGRVQKVKSFLYFSSSEIYGDPPASYIPTPEIYRGNVSSIGPRAPYDESKRLGETMCMIYRNLYKLPVKIVRPFNIYGPGMKQTDYRVLPMFISQSASGKSLSVHADGNQTRTFCYITDGIIGVFRILLSDREGEVYNLGNNDVEISMLNVAKKIVRLTRSNVQIEKVKYPRSYPTDDPQRRCPDLTKIRHEIGYVPKVGLDNGLRRYIYWYKTKYST